MSTTFDGDLDGDGVENRADFGGGIEGDLDFDGDLDDLDGDGVDLVGEGFDGDVGGSIHLFRFLALITYFNSFSPSFNR